MKKRIATFGLSLLCFLGGVEKANAEQFHPQTLKPGETRIVPDNLEPLEDMRILVGADTQTLSKSDNSKTVTVPSYDDRSIAQQIARKTGVPTESITNITYKWIEDCIALSYVIRHQDGSLRQVWVIPRQPSEQVRSNSRQLYFFPGGNGLGLKPKQDLALEFAQNRGIEVVRTKGYYEGGDILVAGKDVFVGQNTIMTNALTQYQSITDQDLENYEFNNADMLDANQYLSKYSSNVSKYKDDTPIANLVIPSNYNQLSEDQKILVAKKLILSKQQATQQTRKDLNIPDNSRIISPYTTEFHLDMSMRPFAREDLKEGVLPEGKVGVAFLPDYSQTQDIIQQLSTRYSLTSEYKSKITLRDITEQDRITQNNKKLLESLGYVVVTVPSTLVTPFDGISFDGKPSNSKMYLLNSMTIGNNVVQATGSGNRDNNTNSQDHLNYIGMLNELESIMTKTTSERMAKFGLNTISVLSDVNSGNGGLDCVTQWDLTQYLNKIERDIINFRKF